MIANRRGAGGLRHALLTPRSRCERVVVGGSGRPGRASGSLSDNKRFIRTPRSVLKTMFKTLGGRAWTVEFTMMIAMRQFKPSRGYKRPKLLENRPFQADRSRTTWRATARTIEMSSAASSSCRAVHFLVWFYAQGTWTHFMDHWEGRSPL